MSIVSLWTKSAVQISFRFSIISTFHTLFTTTINPSCRMHGRWRLKWKVAEIDVLSRKKDTKLEEETKRTGEYRYRKLDLSILAVFKRPEMGCINNIEVLVIHLISLVRHTKLIMLHCTQLFHKTGLAENKVASHMYHPWGLGIARNGDKFAQADHKNQLHSARIYQITIALYLAIFSKWVCAVKRNHWHCRVFQHYFEISQSPHL